ncbi:MAG: deoxyribonuclease V [Chloroflexi bacterium]|nr:deoxyribonuclease V [Chloroflexota bacterium]
MLPPVNSAIIIKDVKIQQLHGWQISIAQAKQIQTELASQVSRKSEAIKPRFIAGVDISAPDARGIARAAAVILNYPELKVIEVKTAEDKLNFPYIPGLLSFREAPLVLAACQKLSTDPDLILADGQGIAHPRRFGIASHLGLLLDIPTIGCAKSRLCGTHASTTAEAGAYTELTDNGEIIGVALRTKANVSPLYVSIGHKIDLPTAIHWVMECCRNQRLPEPSRLAHIAASGKPVPILDNQQQRLFTQPSDSTNPHAE